MNNGITCNKSVFSATFAEFETLHPSLAVAAKRLAENERKNADESDVFKRQPTLKRYFEQNPLRHSVVYVAPQINDARATVDLNAFDGEKLTVIVAKDASLNLLIDAVDTKSRCALIEIHLLESATAEAVLLNENGANIDSFVVVEQASGSRFKSVTVALNAQNCEHSIKCLLLEPTAEANLYGVVFATGIDTVRNTTIMAHIAPNCNSNQHYKAVVSDKASSLFNGVVYVAKDAQHTEAFQKSNNIVLSDGATVRNLPQLEIYADDVKCSHGATTGELDEEALFYMRQRGIPAEEAKRLQLSGFLSDIANHISDEEQRMSIVEKVMTKLI